MVVSHDIFVRLVRLLSGLVFPPVLCPQGGDLADDRPGYRQGVGWCFGRCGMFVDP